MAQATCEVTVNVLGLDQVRALMWELERINLLHFGHIRSLVEEVCPDSRLISRVIA